MKILKNTKIAVLVLVLALIVSAAVLPASGGKTFYINDASSTLGTELGSAYATGSGGVSQLGSGEVFALTGNGLVSISQGGDTTRPGGIGVTGTISLPTDMIKVGIYYYHATKSRDSSLPAANLENVSGYGSGYQLGYYTSNREFVSLGVNLSQTRISMLRDRNMYWGSDGSYHEGTGSITVGCYHLRLPNAYSNYQDALAAAGVYSSSADTFVKYWSGSFYAMVGNYTSAEAAAAGASALGISGHTVDSGSSYTITVVESGTSNILFEFVYGMTQLLAVHPVNSSGKQMTWFKGHKYYGDFIYSRMSGEDLTVVNILPMEDYVKGVISIEMSESWPVEALKAQAVCARTYAASHLDLYKGYGFDVTDDTYCQAYLGTERTGANVTKAVDETAGVYLTYAGEFCSTQYYSSNGGASEDNKNVNYSDVPYLKGIIDPYEEAVADRISNYRWTNSFTPSELAAKLSGYGLASISSVKPTYSATGNMIQLDFTDINGKTQAIKRDQCRTVMGFRSIHYTVEYDSATNKFVFEGAGWGHNVGMSQWGAYSMAQNYNCTYDQILNFYYTDITLSRGVV